MPTVQSTFQFAKDQICKVKDCIESVRCKGLCKLHYDRWLRTGQIEVVATPKQRATARGKICTKSGCDLPVRCSGLCQKHYQWARAGDTCGCGKRKVAYSVLCMNCRLKIFDPPATEKMCPKCKLIMPLDKFGRRRDGRGLIKIQARCLQCTADDSKVYRASEINRLGEEAYKEKKEENRRRSYKNIKSDPMRWFFWALRLSAKTLKLDVAAVVARAEEIGNTCEACGWTGPIANGLPRIHIDHDHATGLFRGFLCSRCNLTVGNIEESIKIANGIARYLKKHGK